jgi:hypothetical protein
MDIDELLQKEADLRAETLKELAQGPEMHERLATMAAVDAVRHPDNKEAMHKAAKDLAVSDELDRYRLSVFEKVHKYAAKVRDLMRSALAQQECRQ